MLFRMVLSFWFFDFVTFSRENDVINLAPKFKTCAKKNIVLVLKSVCDKDLENVKKIKIEPCCQEIWPF